MGKLIKILVALIVLVVIVMIAIPFVVDPNDYKGEITQAVKEDTGRDLQIEGDLKLSLFPWIGVEMGKTVLSNAEGFGDQPFAAIDEVNVKVKLMPLLSKQVEVSTVVLKGLDLNLAKNKQGVTNWDDLTKQEEDETHAEHLDAPSDEPASPAIAALAIGGVSIEQANLVWDDQSSGERYEINDFNVTTGPLSLGQPIDFQLDFGLESEKPKTTAKIDLSGKVVMDSSFEKINVDGLKLQTSAKGETLPNGAVDLTLLASVAIDQVAQTLGVKNLSIRFDETSITGQASVKNFEKPSIGFDLNIDRLNVDKYLPPAPEGAAQQPVATPATAAAAGGSELPLDTLRELDLEGKIAVGELLASGLTIGDLAMAVDAKNGLIKTEQSIGRLYQGQYKGAAQLDARGKQLKVALDEHLKDVQVGALLKDLSGQTNLTGTAQLNAKLTGRGGDTEAIKKTLNGTLDFAVADGAIEGVNILQSIREAQALLKREVAPATEEGNKTVFSKLSGSARVTNGVVNNDDFLLDSSLMQVKGKGTANLVNETLDYRVSADRVSTSSGELKGKPVALLISGTFNKPSVVPDVKGMVMERKKEKIEEKKQELIDKLDEKVGPGAGELLKGFFN